MLVNKWKYHNAIEQRDKSPSSLDKDQNVKTRSLFGRRSSNSGGGSSALTTCPFSLDRVSGLSRRQVRHAEPGARPGPSILRRRRHRDAGGFHLICRRRRASDRSPFP